MMEHIEHECDTQLKEIFKKDILNWMINFVEKPNAKLNGWSPCPYATKARIQNKVNLYYTPPNHFLQDVFHAMDNFDDNFDVYVIGTKPGNFNLDQFVSIKNRLRKQFLGKDIWALFDHPDDTELNNGICFNNGKYLLAMIQRLSKLNDASQRLMKEGYYKDWDQNYLNKLLSSRPRSPKANNHKDTYRATD